MAPLNEALLKAAAALDSIGVRWAIVGGIAVGLRSTVRFTQDLDFAVAVAGDPEAEAVVYAMRSHGYELGIALEQVYDDRMCTVRLRRADSDVIVDLLFATSGIENEIVDAAEPLEVLPGRTAPVATRGHLIAMKALADRDRDLMDLAFLIPEASPGDLKQAREAARLIQQRGTHAATREVPERLEHYINGGVR